MKDIFDSWLVHTFIAHRGFFNNTSVPENSLKAFEAAINHNYAIEFDVQIIKDGTPVVFHDTNLSRMTGQDGYLSNLSKDDLKNYKLLGSDESIPTLDEALKFINGRTPIMVEIKQNKTRLGSDEQKIYDILSKYKGEFAIQSFNPFTLMWFKTNAPEILRGAMGSWMSESKKDIPYFQRFGIRYLLLNKKVCPNFISFDVRNLPNHTVKKYKKLPLIGWVVYSQQEYLKYISMVDNIIFQDFEPKI